MNRTQKGAWFGLGGAVLGLSFMGTFYAAVFAPGDKVVGLETVKFLVGLSVAYFLVGLMLVFRRQSPVEPESDERDKTIQKNAAIACFISVGVSLGLASFIPSLVVGRAGSIPVFLLGVFNLIILQIACFVYGVAILIQYGCVRKGDKS